jgi:hypothetical protein
MLIRTEKNIDDKTLYKKTASGIKCIYGSLFLYILFIIVLIPSCTHNIQAEQDFFIS